MQALYSHRHYRRAVAYICNNLNVVRLPVKVAGYWRQALLPNVVGLSDEDFSEQLGYFYQLEAVRNKHGATMTPDDVRNLKATLPVGSGSRTLVDFLIAKFADDETRDALGSSSGMCGRWGVAAWPAVRWERLREGFPGQLVGFD